MEYVNFVGHFTVVYKLEWRECGALERLRFFRSVARTPSCQAQPNRLLMAERSKNRRIWANLAHKPLNIGTQKSHIPRKNYVKVKYTEEAATILPNSFLSAWPKTQSPRLVSGVAYRDWRVL